jgi:GAF domain-containing protein
MDSSCRKPDRTTGQECARARMQRLQKLSRRVRADFEQTLIDAEMRATERQLEGFTSHRMPVEYAGLDLFDPYFLAAGDRSAVLTALLDAVLALTAADMGLVHAVDPADRTLKVEAQRGFDQSFVDFFGFLDPALSDCRVLVETEQLLWPDVGHSAEFGSTLPGQAMLDAGVRACQATPVVNSDGRLIALVSTHYRQTWTFAESELRVLLRLARIAAYALEHAAARN